MGLVIFLLRSHKIIAQEEGWMLSLHLEHILVVDRSRRTLDSFPVTLPVEQTHRHIMLGRSVKYYMFESRPVHSVASTYLCKSFELHYKTSNKFSNSVLTYVYMYTCRGPVSCPWCRRSAWRTPWRRWASGRWGWWSSGRMHSWSRSSRSRTWSWSAWPDPRQSSRASPFWQRWGRLENKNNQRKLVLVLIRLFQFFFFSTYLLS